MIASFDKAEDIIARDAIPDARNDVVAIGNFLTPLCLYVEGNRG